MIQCVGDMQKFRRDALFLYGRVPTPSTRSSTEIAFSGECLKGVGSERCCRNILLLFLVSSNFMGNWLSQKLGERKGKGAQLITAGTRFREPMNGSRRIFSTLKGLRLN